MESDSTSPGEARVHQDGVRLRAPRSPWPVFGRASASVTHNGERNILIIDNPSLDACSREGEGAHKPRWARADNEYVDISGGAPLKHMRHYASVE